MDGPVNIRRVGCTVSIAIIMTLRRGFFSAVFSQGVFEELKGFEMDGVPSFVAEGYYIFLN